MSDDKTQKLERRIVELERALADANSLIMRSCECPLRFRKPLGNETVGHVYPSCVVETP